MQNYFNQGVILQVEAIKFAALKSGIAINQVTQVLKLLIEQECTIPFVTRYRKEMTGGLDEVQIEAIKDFYELYIEQENRRQFILDTIKKMEQLTPELEKQIRQAKDLNELEDIYAPYKSKKKTKGQGARSSV
jgi:uncharacterized protein